MTSVGQYALPSGAGVLTAQSVESEAVNPEFQFQPGQHSFRRFTKVNAISSINLSPMGLKIYVEKHTIALKYYFMEYLWWQARNTWIGDPDFFIPLEHCLKWPYTIINQLNYCWTWNLTNGTLFQLRFRIRGYRLLAANLHIKLKCQINLICIFKNVSNNYFVFTK